MSTRQIALTPPSIGLLVASLLFITSCSPAQDTAAPEKAEIPASATASADSADTDAGSNSVSPDDDARTAVATGQSPAESIHIDPPASEDEANRRIEAYLAMLDEVDAKLGDDAPDPDELIDQLDYDPERIIDFVQQHIAYEHYTGTLRGARNTLRGHAGNSLDQSLLLATMLKDAGYDANIVKTDVDNAVINQLAAKTGRDSIDESADASVKSDDLMAIVRKHAAAMGLDEQAVKQLSKRINTSDNGKRGKTLSDSKAIAATLRKSLEKGGVKLTDGSGNSAGTSGYFWVRFREGGHQPWRDVHTSLNLPPAIQSLTPATTFAGEIPDSLQHRVRIEVLVEQLANGKPKLTSLGAWERPSANLPDTPINVQVFPMSWMSTNSVWLRQDPGVPDRDIFQVSIDGAPLASSFDTSGNIVPADAAASNYAALFATVSDKMNGAAGLLGQLGGKGELDRSRRALTLSAVVLRYSFSAPDGQTRSFDRRIFSVDMPEVAGKESAINSPAGRELLTRRFLLHYTTYRHTEQEAVRAMLARARRVAEAYRYGVTPDTDDSSGGWSGSSILFSLFDASSVASKTYRDTPHLVVYSSTPGIYAARREFVDVVNNHRTIRTPDSTDIAVEQGAWESLTEGSLINAKPRPVATGKAFRIVRNESALQDISGRLGPFATENAAANLRDGYVLAFPEQSGNDRWWRIANDGETLRIMADGSGGETMEYVALQHAGRVITCLNAVFAGCSLLTKIGSAAAMVGQKAAILAMMLDIAEGIGVSPTSIGNSVDPALGTEGALVVTASSAQAAAAQAFIVCRDRLSPRCFKP